VEDMVRGGEVQAGASRLERQDEDARRVSPRLFLETLDHDVARASRRAAVEEDDLHAETFAKIGDEPVTHLAELGEHEGLVAGGYRFFEHLGDACELSTAPFERTGLAEVVRGVIADLLER